MKEWPNGLPGKFTIEALSRYYDVQWEADENHYHIWQSGKDYRYVFAHSDCGKWNAKDVQRNVQIGDWRIVSIQDDDIDEEDIPVGSLEGIL